MADSVCRELNKYPQHNFCVVLSSYFCKTSNAINEFGNVKVFEYDIPNKLSTVLFGRDRFLDELVKNEGIEAVLTIFGPSRWNPKVPHLCGFARGQLLPFNTPYFKQVSFKEKCLNAIVKRSFRKNADHYWTENEAVTEMLKTVFPDKKVYTVSNSYNQVFDELDSQKVHPLQMFDGATLLTVTNPYPHKNITLSIGIANVLKELYPDFNFRFVFTIDKNQFPSLDVGLQEHFVFTGKVDISECPDLYRQADIMFQPSLIECFTATYPEAMRMGVPIVTSDLEFAHGLCGNAAVYYSPLDAEKAGEAIYKVATDHELRKYLIEEGKKQLKNFLDAETRAERLVQLTEKIGGSQN